MSVCPPAAATFLHVWCEGMNRWLNCKSGIDRLIRWKWAIGTWIERGKEKRMEPCVEIEQIHEKKSQLTHFERHILIDILLRVQKDPKCMQLWFPSLRHVYKHTLRLTKLTKCRLPKRILNLAPMRGQLLNYAKLSCCLQICWLRSNLPNQMLVQRYLSLNFEQQRSQQSYCTGLKCHRGRDVVKVPEKIRGRRECRMVVW